MAPGSELLFTQVARVRRLACVHAPMDVDRTLLPEALRAELADKGFDVVVDAHVLVEVFTARKRVAAHFADVTLLARVHRHVHTQLRIVHARLGTHLRTPQFDCF